MAWIFNQRDELLNKFYGFDQNSGSKQFYQNRGSTMEQKKQNAVHGSDPKTGVPILLILANKKQKPRFDPMKILGPEGTSKRKGITWTPLLRE